MPKIEDILKKPTSNRKSKFTRVNYRPWEDSFMDEGGENNFQREEVTKNSSQLLETEVLNEASIVAHESIKENVAKEKNKDTVPHIKKYPFRLESVVGLQRTILFFLLRNEYSRDDDWVECAPLSVKEIAAGTKIKHGSLESALVKLRKRVLLKSLDSKTGRGGFVSFAIPMYVIKQIEALKSKLSSYP
jgi:hypothetical protein